MVAAPPHGGPAGATALPRAPVELGKRQSVDKRREEMPRTEKKNFPGLASVQDSGVSDLEEQRTGKGAGIVLVGC